MSSAESSFKDWLAREKMCGSFKGDDEVIFVALLFGGSRGGDQIAVLIAGQYLFFGQGCPVHAGLTLKRGRRRARAEKHQSIENYVATMKELHSNQPSRT